MIMASATLARGCSAIFDRFRPVFPVRKSGTAQQTVDATAQ
jgi:hypothetical protein